MLVGLSRGDAIISLVKPIKMGYSKYRTIKQVVKKFGLSTQKQRFFEEVKPVSPSDWLVKTLELAELVTLSNEKVKSEKIISPILTEIHRLYKDKLALFSGEELNVDPENDLAGPCDFFFSARPNTYLLEAPIVSLTEAKDEDLDYGIAQCTAQMIGAQRYNQQEGENIPVIWGCATTADVWKFIRLENTILYVDTINYYLDNVGVLLGAFSVVFDEIG